MNLKHRPQTSTGMRLDQKNKTRRYTKRAEFRVTMPLKGKELNMLSPWVSDSI